MPLGIVRKGYRYYDTNSIGLCYNCKQGTLKCCKNQQDVTLYPNLKSPDYIFQDDFNKRYENKKYFLSNKLKIY